MRKNWKQTAALVVLLVLAATCVVLFYLRQSPDTPQIPVVSSSLPEQSVSSQTESEPEKKPPEAETYDYPQDQLFITPKRQEYKAGDFRLVIPVLSLDIPVEAGVDTESLNAGPGLYDYAQMPGWGNPNVSIAGHRDIHGSPFYYIDKLTDGDYMYLVWQEKVYIYTYKQTEIVKANDWSPIYCGEDSRLTLTSCDPIGTSWNRIIVTGVLSDVVWEEDFDFPPCAEEPQTREIWPLRE